MTYTTLDDLPVILNAGHVAQILGISKGLAYQLFRRGDFPAVQLGRRKLVARDAFVAWFNRQQNGGAA